MNYFSLNKALILVEATAFDDTSRVLTILERAEIIKGYLGKRLLQTLRGT